MGETPEWISHSALAQYIRCGEQYRLERVEKVPHPPAWYFIGGKAVHLATQWMDERDAYPYSDNQLAHIWSEAYDEEISKAFQEWPDDSEWLQAGRRGAEQGYSYWDLRGNLAVTSWHDWRLDPNTPIVVGIEEDVEITLPSGIVLKGYVDRVVRDIGDDPGHYGVIDIKTGTKRPGSPLQLGFYKIGLEVREPGWKIDRGSWWMAKDGKAFEVDISHITVDTLDRYATKYFKGVEQEIFIPNVGDACFFCPFKKECFAYPKGEK